MRCIVPALAALALLSGCSRSDVPLSSRPADVDTARDLARSVADAGHCGGLEDLGAGTGYWDFTCQAGDRSFTITAVTDRRAFLARAAALSRSSAPVKTGTWYLVQEGLDFGQSKSGSPRATPVSDLDRFPGQLMRVAG